MRIKLPLCVTVALMLMVFFSPTFLLSLRVVEALLPL
jgi:hypothetical protein